MYRLKITGLGYSLSLELDPDSTTVANLKAAIEEQTGLPPVYQRLLARSTKLDDAAASELSLSEAGLKDRTKIMLLHSAIFAQEKEGFAALQSISKEMQDLSDRVKKQSGEDLPQPAFEPEAVSEFVTRLCCRLDEIDTAGSENLRAQRKALLKRAEQIEKDAHQEERSSSQGESNAS